VPQDRVMDLSELNALHEAALLHTIGERRAISDWRFAAQLTRVTPVFRNIIFSRCFF
jgi:hypothetical protein